MNYIRWALLGMLLIVMVPGTSWSEEFKLFGVKFGMTRQEFEQTWIKLESGKYSIQEAVLFDIVPDFDHQDRLYKLSFSVPIPLQDQYPQHFVASAFQKQLQEKWGKDPSIAFSIRSGRGKADLSLTQKALQDKYIAHISEEVATQMPILFRPEMAPLSP